MTQSPARGLVVDWGGVVTQPLRECIAEWAETENLDSVGVMRSLNFHITGELNPLQQLERGEVSRADIEDWLADVFAEHGPRPEPTGIFDRMFAPIRTNPDMIELMRTAKSHGLRTGLLSNSWGDSYDRTNWDEVFDVVVISEDVGMRKPEQRIFDHMLSLLELTAEEVIYVDDEYPNVEAALTYGLQAIHCDPRDPQRIDRITRALNWA